MAGSEERTPVIPGRRVSAGPGIQMHTRSKLLDSGLAPLARPGMTTRDILAAVAGINQSAIRANTRT
jgi:hypothetical protein